MPSLSRPSFHLPAPGTHRAYYSINGSARDLGLLGGFSNLSAAAINRYGLIVGSAYNANAIGHIIAILLENQRMVGRAVDEIQTQVPLTGDRSRLALRRRRRLFDLRRFRKQRV